MSSISAAKRTKLSPEEESSTELESHVTEIETINMPPDLIHTYLIPNDPILFLVVNKEFNAHASTKLWKSLDEEPSWFPGRPALTARVTRLYSPLYKAIAGNRPEYVKRLISHPRFYKRDTIWLIQKLSDRGYYGTNRYTKDIIVALLSSPKVHELMSIFPFDEIMPTLEEIPILLDAINTATPGYFLDGLATYRACMSLLLINPQHEESVLRIFVDFLVSIGVTVNFNRPYFFPDAMHVHVDPDGRNIMQLRLKLDLALMKNRIYVPREVEYIGLLITLIHHECKELMDAYSDIIIEYVLRIGQGYTITESAKIMVCLQYIVMGINQKKIDNTELAAVVKKMCVSHPLFVDEIVYRQMMHK